MTFHCQEREDYSHTALLYVRVGHWTCRQNCFDSRDLAQSCDNVPKYKKRLLLKCIHHFILDIISNMDHMRISGTEPSSVILSQTKYFKKLKMMPKIAETS